MEEQSRSQGKLTTSMNDADCPAEAALRSISGKWKPRILRLAMDAPIRFNQLLRDLPGASKQAVTIALRELEADGVLLREVKRLKPLHVEYQLTEQGRSLIPILKGLERRSEDQ